MVMVVISTNGCPPAASNHDTCKAVESNNRTFIIHKEYICFYSPFFDAAFNGKFKEAENQSISLEDVDLAVFGLLVHWVYYQKFDLPRVEGKEGKFCADYEKLAELWILAQRTLMSALQNHVIDIIFDSLSKIDLWDGSNFGRLMELASENDPTSPLSRLAINTLVYSCGLFFDAQVSSTPPSLTTSIMKGLKTNHAERKSWDEGIGEKSNYHVAMTSEPRKQNSDDM
ncbi:BTB/POZ domain-containing protein [Phlyctema vagabunda]|uniref:BTB/POZ domain-containing protein n=1 Tax=Phlyctema vagabunda TaxID=108571 RepID=A0ABR4PL96_9HELO